MGNRRKIGKTIRQRIMDVLFAHRGRIFTATQLAKAINENLATVSGIIRKLVLEDKLNVTENYGPRKGNGYSFKAL